MVWLFPALTVDSGTATVSNVVVDVVVVVADVADVAVLAVLAVVTVGSDLKIGERSMAGLNVVGSSPSCSPSGANVIKHFTAVIYGLS